jgi:anti-sigma B factor antagonist
VHDHLTIETRSTGKSHTLVLTGGMDLASAPDLTGELERLCLEGAEEIVVDLRGVGFIDSSGLHALLAAQRFCAEQRCRYFLIRLEGGQPQRLFDITGTLDLLPFRDPAASVAPRADRAETGAAAVPARSGRIAGTGD